MGDKKAVRRFNPEDKSLPKLWTADVCPYAARANVGLHEIGVEFEAVKVDLQNKPASLFEVNKKGLVPAMKDQGNCINDSYNVLQYIDEMWANPEGKTLFPKTPAERSVARTWCEYINKEAIPLFYQVLMKETEEEREACKSKLLDAIKTIDKGMRDTSDGPFFFGDKFGIVDIMIAPHIDRFPALTHYAGIEIPETEDFKRFNDWWRNVKNHPSFQPTKVTPQFVIDAYKVLGEKIAKSKLAQAK